MFDTRVLSLDRSIYNMKSKQEFALNVSQSWFCNVI